jgi:glycosyltransferase involved in cell wall biosynthesis
MSERDQYSPAAEKSIDGLIWGMDITQGALAATIQKLRQPNCPLVLTIQYGGGEDRIDQARGGLIAHSLKWMLTKADHVVGISTYLMDLANEYGYSGPATLIPNGVDLTSFSPPSHTQPHHPPRIITTSRLASKNGIDILLRAIKLLQTDFPQIQCDIVGEGDERESLVSLANDLDIQDSVNFIGFIPHEQIPQALWQSDIFVRPSRTEGMGNAFIEALAAGLPIIGTPIGGIPEIIDDRKTGLFVNPEDPSDVAEKIRMLINQPSLSDEIIRNGRQLVADRFSWDSISGEYGDLFAGLLEQ